MTHRYSLADYTITITMPTADNGAGKGSVADYAGKSLTIGGPGDNNEGSFLGEITVTRENDVWQTQSDPTGSWVHSKSLAKNGTITLALRQVSDDILKLHMIARAYEHDDVSTSGMTITISNDTETVVQATDCYIVKYPDWQFQEQAQTQEWTFTCGRITYDNLQTSW